MVPYGYRIEDGRAVVDAEAAARIRTFVEGYLGGLSVIEANRNAGIPLSTASLYNLLQNRVYLGDAFYPPILAEGDFRAVQEAREARTHPKTLSEAEPVTVRDRFRLAPLAQPPRRAAAAGNAAYLYSRITPAPEGDAVASVTEMAAIRRWANPREPAGGAQVVKREDLKWQ